jgi:hypothetical protein
MADKKFKRVFKRLNSDGSENLIVMEWDPRTPLSSFNMDVNGYTGASCLSELGDVERLIGSAAVTEKPEFYQGEDPQAVFIVGSN